MGFRAGDVNLHRYVGNNPANATDPSGLREVDDNPDNPNIRWLVDVKTQVETHITYAVRSVASDPRFYHDKEGGIQAVFQRLGAAGGFGLDRIKSQIEIDLFKSLSQSRREIYVPSGARGSRYGQVPIANIPSDSPAPTGILGGGTAVASTSAAMTPFWIQQIPFMFLQQFFADSALAPVIKVADVPMGLDKWGHFFEEGYWYYEAFPGNTTQSEVPRLEFGLFLEGDPNYLSTLNPQDLARWTALAAPFVPPANEDFPFMNRPGRHGWLASGVISYADLTANEGGFWFYRDLDSNWQQIVANPSSYRFDIEAHFRNHGLNLRMMNEYWNPNFFHPYLTKPGASVTGPSRNTR